MRSSDEIQAELNGMEVAADLLKAELHQALAEEHQWKIAVAFAATGLKIGWQVFIPVSMTRYFGMYESGYGTIDDIRFQAGGYEVKISCPVFGRHQAKWVPLDIALTVRNAYSER